MLAPAPVLELDEKKVEEKLDVQAALAVLEQAKLVEIPKVETAPVAAKSPEASTVF